MLKRTTELTAHVKNKKVEKLLPLDPADFGRKRTNRPTNSSARPILTLAIGWIVAVTKSVSPALSRLPN